MDYSEKTYEEETAALVARCKKATAEADEKIRQLLPKMKGRDGLSTPIMREVTDMWNRGLIKLKIKYGKPLDEGERRIMRIMKENQVWEQEGED